MRLSGKTAIITGAASGIGRAAAVLFAREGASVVVADINEAGAAETLRLIQERGVEAVSVKADLSKERDAAHVIEQAMNNFRRIDILFNNAATNSYTSTLETDETELDRVFGVNIKSIFFLARTCIPHMTRAGAGSIINMSSITGIVGAPAMAAYSASKGAIITLTRTMAMELAEAGIRVNCICPASIDTPMLSESFERTSDAAHARAQNIKRHPLGRLGTPEDVANFALFLASDESAWVTGGTHVIDGGASIARRWKE
jgi:NAD(P)-dependent dehydrogenase (short-subunit alcohol dehydrogenase family)